MKNKVMDIYRPKNETLNDAFDRLVVKIHHQNRMYGHKTFVLTGCEPMVGTTTIAINVAISLAVSGLKTILIDGDLRKDGKYKRLNDSVEMGLSDVLAGNLDLASAICATNYVTLDYLPSGIKDENPVGLLYSPNLNEVIASLSEYYDYVIFDLPSANAAIDSNIFASKCDAVVLVAKQYSTNVMQIRNAKQELEKIAANLVGIVFNNVDSVEYRRYMKNYDYFNKNKFLVTKKKKKGKNEEGKKKKKASKKGAETSAFDLDYEVYVDDDSNKDAYLKNESKPDIYDENVAKAILDEETSEEITEEAIVSEAKEENESDEKMVNEDASKDGEIDEKSETESLDMSGVIDEVDDDVIAAELDSVVGDKDDEFQEVTDEEFSSEEDYADNVYRENFAMKVAESGEVYKGVYNQAEYNNGYVANEVMDNVNMGYDNSYIKNGTYGADYSVETGEIATMIGSEYAQPAFASEEGYGEYVNDGTMGYEQQVNQYNTYSDNNYNQEQQLYNQENYDTAYAVNEMQDNYVNESLDVNNGMTDNNAEEIQDENINVIGESTEEVTGAYEEAEDAEEESVRATEEAIEEVTVSAEETENIEEENVREAEEVTEEVTVSAEETENTEEENVREAEEVTEGVAVSAEETENTEKENVREAEEVTEEMTVSAEETENIEEENVREAEEVIEEVTKLDEEAEDNKEVNVSVSEESQEDDEIEEIDFIEEDIEEQSDEITSYRKQLDRLKERFNFKSHKTVATNTSEDVSGEKNSNYHEMDKGLDEVVSEIEEEISQQTDKEI